MFAQLVSDSELGLTHPYSTTFLGTIMNRFSKDVDLIDNVISDAVRMLMGTLVQSIGSIVLVSVSLPWFLIAIAVICLMYHYLALFYRASSREFKVSQSSLYAYTMAAQDS